MGINKQVQVSDNDYSKGKIKYILFGFLLSIVIFLLNEHVEMFEYNDDKNNISSSMYNRKKKIMNLSLSIQNNSITNNKNENIMSSKTATDTETTITNIYNEQQIPNIIINNILNGSITCLGGSSTTGVTLASQEESYPSILSKLLSNHTVYNMAHGATKTLYAGYNFENLVDPTSSIIIWEFAQNDGNSKGDCELKKDKFFIFYNQIINRMVSKKPTLIFVMLWDVGFDVPPKMGTNIKTCFAPLLKNQLVIDVCDYVKSECNINEDCDRLDFVNYGFRETRKNFRF